MLQKVLKPLWALKYLNLAFECDIPVLEAIFTNYPNRIDLIIKPLMESIFKNNNLTSFFPDIDEGPITTEQTSKFKPNKSTFVNCLLRPSLNSERNEIAIFLVCVMSKEIALYLRIEHYCENPHNCSGASWENTYVTLGWISGDFNCLRQIPYGIFRQILSKKAILDCENFNFFEALIGV